MTTQQWDSDAFWSGQDFQTSARLHLQHWIWNYQLGYALHPNIDTNSSQPLRIADVAAGNGAWLLELSRSLPKETIQLSGFDITSSNFPSQGWLPSNINFHIWDAFTSVPEEYIGVFDIVHIRAFYSCIKDNNVQPVLDNLLKLLKPGGYLQWDESDASTLTCYLPSKASAEVESPAAEIIVRIQNILGRAQSKLLPDWIHNIPATVHQNGCEMIAHDEFQPSPELARAWNDNILLVWRDLIPMMPEAAMPLPLGMGLPETLSRESFVELFKQAVDECSKGARLGMVYHVFVAKKRSWN